MLLRAVLPTEVAPSSLPDLVLRLKEASLPEKRDLRCETGGFSDMHGQSWLSKRERDENLSLP